MVNFLFLMNILFSSNKFFKYPVLFISKTYISLNAAQREINNTAGTGERFISEQQLKKNKNYLFDCFWSWEHHLQLGILHSQTHSRSNFSMTAVGPL